MLLGPYLQLINESVTQSNGFLNSIEQALGVAICVPLPPESIVLVIFSSKSTSCPVLFPLESPRFQSGLVLVYLAKSASFSQKHVISRTICSWACNQCCGAGAARSRLFWSEPEP
jgi:hypothetical protein